MKNPPDLLSTFHGSIISIDAETPRGRRWLERHVPDQEHGHVIAEHRYGVDILTGALSAGLRLKDTTTGRIAVPTK